MAVETISPLVTIITPAYNRASYLEETIRSVLTQDYPHIEYIVLDDGSTDHTRQALENYTGRLFWESHPNMGETRTVNKGFGLANGEIIAVVNSDDPLLPGAIPAMVRLMQERPELLMVYPDWNMIDAEGRLIEHIATFDYNYVDMLRWHHCIPGPGAFFQRSVVKQLGGRDPQFRYVADFDFWLRAGLLGPAARIPQTLATFRWHPGGASSRDKGVRMAEEHIRLINKIYALSDLPREMLAVKAEAYSSAHYVAGVVCGDNALEERRYHYRRALRYAPLKHLFEYRDRLPVFLGTERGWIAEAMCLTAKLLVKTLGVRRHGGV